MFSAWKLNQYANYNLESQKKHTKVPNQIHSTPTLESTKLNQNPTTSDEFNRWSIFQLDIWSFSSRRDSDIKISKHKKHIELDIVIPRINNVFYLFLFLVRTWLVWSRPIIPVRGFHLFDTGQLDPGTVPLDWTCISNNNSVKNRFCSINTSTPKDLDWNERGRKWCKSYCSAVCLVYKSCPLRSDTYSTTLITYMFICTSSCIVVNYLFSLMFNPLYNQWSSYDHFNTWILDGRLPTDFWTCVHTVICRGIRLFTRLVCYSYAIRDRFTYFVTYNINWNM